MSEHCSVLPLLLHIGCACLLLGGTKAANFTLMNVYQTSHTEAEIGQPVSFICEFNYTGDSEISKMMFGKFYTQSNHTVDYGVDVLCNQRVYKDTISCKLSLTIYPRPKDENLYHCEVLIPRPQGIIEVRGTGTTLSLHAEPTSVEMRSIPLLLSGRDAMLLCLASGFYPGNPTVSWFRSGLPVPPNNISTDIIRERNGTFFLHSAYRFIPTKTDHTRVCLCQVSHQAWKQKWAGSTTLNVSAEPLSMEIQPLSLLVSGNETVLLCMASHFYPQNPVVQWLHRNLSVPPSSVANDIIKASDGTFSLRSQYRFIPSEEDHAAVCFCRVSHSAWTQQRTVNITLNVHYGPSAVGVISHSGSVDNSFVSVAVGSTVNLSCAANGNPSPKIQWLRGNITGLDSTEHLYISSVQKEDEGLYSCVAQNQYGERNYSITVKVINSGISTCLLVKLLLIGILILLDTIMFTIYIIRKNRMISFELPELSVPQILPPQGESPSPQTAKAPEPPSLSTNQIPPH